MIIAEATGLPWQVMPDTKADEVGGSCSTGIECAKVQLSMTARKGATQ